MDVPEETLAISGYYKSEITKINKFMLNGLTYDKACQAAGYDFKKGIANSTKTNLLPIPTEDEQITNPVVKRAFAQTRKVINALIREYGSFDMINIELAREVGGIRTRLVDSVNI